MSRVSGRGFLAVVILLSAALSTRAEESAVQSHPATSQNGTATSQNGTATSQNGTATSQNGTATSQNDPASPPSDASPQIASPQDAPDLTLWLWHGRHDLRGLHQATGGRVGVAYLARTLMIGRGRVQEIPRHDPIYLDKETERAAVVHVELLPGTSADDLAALQADVLAAIEPVFAENASGIQIDFDAPRSFRATYARLLRAIAARKPQGHALSMTAIGSWCMEDRWLADVPVDLVVPMLFGPGHEREIAIAALRRGPFREARCNQALGIREGDPRPPRAERLYVFRQGGWTLDQALQTWGRSSSVRH